MYSVQIPIYLEASAGYAAHPATWSYCCPSLPYHGCPPPPPLGPPLTYGGPGPDGFMNTDRGRNPMGTNLSSAPTRSSGMHAHPEHRLPATQPRSSPTGTLQFGAHAPIHIPTRSLATPYHTFHYIPIDHRRMLGSCPLCWRALRGRSQPQGEGHMNERFEGMAQDARWSGIRRHNNTAPGANALSANPSSRTLIEELREVIRCGLCSKKFHAVCINWYLRRGQWDMGPSRCPNCLNRCSRR
ncbi:hypothetical protein P175DRAFT_01879 [Aspergillus ochraceoroseus IBT 24754]|uniref:Uncharacterized protein n=1 Tax=Aspergillus ochraceoroseus IBT 24754 TaxID=1392256 RepID=A0A2T5M588_9EURO|nr:uncharacterized protein P175DRAFT_01879 [Aspergillus ochraceoroseus IBT 24754]PTU23701.1 hypothetical protein P175DRAFT_01879 [Aspergillus ochraceoroseus IBT 24754]